jgi:hypothetical protein
VNEVLNQFRNRVSELRKRSSGLSASLREASRGLSETGRVTSTELIEDLWQFRNDFRDLRSSWPCHEDGVSNAISTADSLVALEQEVESHAAVRGALAVLNCLEAIEPQGDRELPMWQGCVAEGRALRDQLLASSPSESAACAKRLLALDHPLRAIVTLVAQAGELSDERWLALNDVVAESYGRDLVTAIVRHRLILPPTAETAANELRFGDDLTQSGWQ